MAGSTILAAGGLVFAVLSFWMIWVRRGRLLCNIPAEVARVRMVDGVQVALPLVFYNTGARALVVEAMELHVQPPRQQTLVWNLTRSSLVFSADDSRDFGRSFAVRGRDSVERVAQFVDRDTGSLSLDAGVGIPALLLVRLADRRYLEPATTVVLLKPDESVTHDDSIVTRPWREGPRTAARAVAKSKATDGPSVANPMDAGQARALDAPGLGQESSPLRRRVP